MRHIVIIIFLLATSFNLLKAQDIIVKNNGKHIQCIILEETYEAIKYRKYSEPNGTIFRISKEKVFSVEYEQAANPLEINDTIDQVSFHEPLTISNGFWGLIVKQGDKKLSKLAVRDIFKEYPEALALYKQGKTINTLGSIIGLPSAFFLGYGLGTLLAGGEVNGVTMAIFGVGTAVGITLNIVGNSDIKSSVHLYNKAIKKQASASLNFGVGEYGVGLIMQF